MDTDDPTDVPSGEALYSQLKTDNGFFLKTKLWREIDSVVDRFEEDLSREFLRRIGDRDLSGMVLIDYEADRGTMCIREVLRKHRSILFEPFSDDDHEAAFEHTFVIDAFIRLMNPGSTRYPLISRLLHDFETAPVQQDEKKKEKPPKQQKKVTRVASSYRGFQVPNEFVDAMTKLQAWKTSVHMHHVSSENDDVDFPDDVAPIFYKNRRAPLEICSVLSKFQRWKHVARKKVNKIVSLKYYYDHPEYRERTKANARARYRALKHLPIASIKPDTAK